jgi:hypothetical protein
LREIIGAVHQKVDSAIDWLIEKEVSMGKAFLDTLKAGAGAVKGGVAGLIEWWKTRKKITNIAGEHHELFFEGEGSLARLMIGSPDETKVEVYLKEMKTGADEKTLESIVEAENILDNLKVITMDTGKTIKEQEESKETNKKIMTEIEKLAGLLMTLGGTPEPPLPDVEWDWPTYGHAWVEKLSTKTSGGGEKPKGIPDWWTFCQRNNLTTRTDKWVRMHLISEKVGGSGEEKNLIPAPNSVNTGPQVLHTFEEAAKYLVEQKKATKKGAVVQKSNVIWLNVEAKNHRSSPPKNAPADYNNDWFFKELTMQGGLHFYNKDWIKDSAGRFKENVEIPAPDFEPEIQSLSKPSKSGLRALHDLLTESIYELIHDEALRGPFTDSNNFENRMKERVNNEDTWKDLWVADRIKAMRGKKGIIPTISDLVGKNTLKY